MNAWLVLLAIGLLVWFWVDSMHAREVALTRCAALCRELNVQLLDQTVRVARLRLGRAPDGGIRLRRFYAYEFSIDGHDRWYGVVVLLGRRVEYLRMELPDGPVIQDYAQ